jgi:threonine dehydrogenase-like Zn-dependent dehydrogenase
MTAPRFLGGGKIDFVEKPIPTPGPGELLIEVKANALCGSELGQYRNGTPITPGHEAAGIVAAAGPSTHTAVGTPGVIYLMDFCGQCRSCRLGLTNQCLNKRADMGFSHDGGYGPYELIHESIFFPTPPELPLAEATLAARRARHYLARLAPGANGASGSLAVRGRQRRRPYRSWRARRRQNIAGDGHTRAGLRPGTLSAGVG